MKKDQQKKQKKRKGKKNRLRMRNNFEKMFVVRRLRHIISANGLENFLCEIHED